MQNSLMCQCGICYITHDNIRSTGPNPLQLVCCDKLPGSAPSVMNLE